MNLKNILIIGSGSIAKKHAKIFNKKKIKIFVINIKDINVAKNRITYLLNNFEINAAIICSPANTHLKYINFFKKKKINYLVEKPIFTDNELKLINKNFTKKNRLTELVGYQLRYSKTLNKLKKLLDLKVQGKVYCVKIFVNSYLPLWRKRIKNSISLSKEKGGGVLLELSHEIDYMLWLFGNPKHLRALIDETKLFNKEVEERVNIFFYYNNFVLQLDMSFNSRFENRSILIEGTEGSLKADLLKNTIHLNRSGLSKIIYKNNQKKSNMLFEQDNFFIKSVNKKQNKNNLLNSLKVLKLIKLSRKSNSNNRKIKVV